MKNIIRGIAYKRKMLMKMCIRDSIHRGYKKYTKASVSGQGIRWCYAESFSISEDKVKATGFPRTDSFFDKEFIQKTKNDFYEAYPELKNKKIILFAPTSRSTKINDASYDFSKIDFQAIYDQFHDQDYVFIIKWHPAIYNNMVMNLSLIHILNIRLKSICFI